MMIPRVEKQEKQVGVYRPGTSFKSTPDDYVGAQEAKRLKNNGEAYSVNHGKAIRLKRYPADRPNEELPPRCGLSARPSATSIERYAAAVKSNKDDLAIVAALAWTGPVLSGQELDASNPDRTVA